MLYSFFPFVKFERLSHKRKGNNRHQKRKEFLDIYIYTHMKTKKNVEEYVHSSKKNKQTNNEKIRTTIIMQLVRIWRLKESKGRYVKVI